MGHRCCSKQKIKRGLWSPEEDEKLVKYITIHGHKSWSSVPKFAGLQRCGKSCRLRWINYLRPDLKRGSFTAEEEQIIIDIHRILGNRWAQIAKHLPGRTDNEVKNFWNSCIKKKLISQGLDPQTHTLLSSHRRTSASTNNIPQNSNSIFIINSHIPNAPIETTQKFSSFPKARPNVVQTHSTLVSNEFQASSNFSNKFSNFPQELLVHYTSNICSPSCMNNPPPTFVSRVDDAEEFGGPILEEGAQVQVLQENDKNCENGIGVRQEDKGNLDILDDAMEGSNFDFGLLESVLASEFMSHDLNCMDDLAWNF